MRLCEKVNGSSELLLRNSHWLATSGQFLRLSGKTARAWLQEQQDDTDAEIAKTRQRLKAWQSLGCEDMAVWYL